MGSIHVENHAAFTFNQCFYFFALILVKLLEKQKEVKASVRYGPEVYAFHLEKCKYFMSFHVQTPRKESNLYDHVEVSIAF